MDLERSRVGSPEANQEEPGLAFDSDSERVLRRSRLLFLYKVSGPAFLFFLVQSLRLGLELGLILNLVALGLFALSIRTLFSRDNITRASWYYILGFSVLVGFTPIIDGHLHSSVIWLLPLIPVIAAHLLGVRAIVLVAGCTSLAVVGTWQASLHFEIRPEHHFQLFDKVILHLFALLLASGLGLSAIRAAKRQIQVIRSQEDELYRAQRALESARKAKAMFLANMSHEIRTPLNGILGMTEIMDREDLDPEDKQAVQGARHCGQQLLGLLNGVLDLSKLEAGKLSLREGCYALASVKQELQDQYLEKFQSLGIEFRVQRSAQSLELWGDRNRLVQVLSVFLQNALQFSESSVVELSSCLEQEEEGEAWMVWTIQDNGVGMSQELLERVQPQSPDSLLRSSVGFQGAGLGIDLAMKLVALMGGAIRVESELGQGVMARVRLPLRRANSGPREALASESPGTARGRSSIRVLLVDDNEINRKIGDRLLGQFDCEVSQAEDGAQAVAMAHAQPYDLILMDLQMPVMDGMTASRKIRAESGPNQATPISALTAGDFDEDPQAREAAGMTDFLSKPIQASQLERVLRAVGWAPSAKRAS